MSESITLQHRTIISVKQLLSEGLLTIPEYQRPYKWNIENIASLFDDIKMQLDKPAYRLGTVVLHHEKNSTTLNIVDGQQRTLTLMLAVLAINERYKDEDTYDAKHVRKVLGDLPQKAVAFSKKQSFSSNFSLYNLHENYKAISRIISRGDFTPKHIEFLLDGCEVVIFILNDESEAFQFFDSQNARGKDLYPHDLLKAFHLREFNTDDEQLKKDTVTYWESLDDDKLAWLFSKHLYRIKRWSKGKSAQFFGKHDIAEFKGISLDKENVPPYAKSLSITHYYIDDYNNSIHRSIAKTPTSYPFSLEQKIINGKRFFEMVEHYDALIKTYRAVQIQKSDIEAFSHEVTLFEKKLNQRASKVVYTLNTYSKYRRHRKGDRHTRNIFDNAMIYYIDKFGTENLSQAIEILFIWAYQIRLKNYSVRPDGMDNHANSNNGMFNRIQEATVSKDVVVTAISSLKYSEIYTNQLPEIDEQGKESAGEIYRLFRHLNYITLEKQNEK
ncbi:DUF262 domain-containing protein [Psychrobacter sp. BF1]|uniref:DUF262 domain-containing protein n=1 Tax=Psychrobacter sp. BF1 TaxID=2821147 RepID=UPI001C4E1873|nr:DUF262 domain-containing protein [Psychrobacter sp. BF1]